MHKIAHDTLKLKRWLRMACDRLELMPSDLYEPLGVDAGTWGCWTSLTDERFINVGNLPTVLSCLDEQALQDLNRILRDLSSPETPKPSVTRA